MDLGGCKALEMRQMERFAEDIDASVFEELITGFVYGWDGGVVLELAGTGELPREVVACVEELEEAAYGVKVFVTQIDCALLCPQLAPIHAHAHHRIPPSNPPLRNNKKFAPKPHH